MYDVLIFDLDGTLVDSLEDIAQSVNFSFQKYNLPEKSLAEIRINVGLGIENLIFSCLKQTKGGMAPDWEWESEKENILKTFREHYFHHCADKSRLYEGVPEFLEKYKHLKMALFTNKAQVYTDKILRDFKIHKYFASVVSGDTTAQKKPETAGMLKIFEDLNTTPDKCIMIGDSAPDVEVAKKTGVLSIALSGGIGELAPLKESAPDYLINNFLEVEPILDNLKIK